MEKLLFTGGTGFLGRNVRPILDKIYDVTTCGITSDDMLKVNLANEVPVLDKHYDIVLHACGKAHVVPKSEADKQAFYDVNYQGTVNICAALEKVGVPKALIFISTVAVYGCETGSDITEEHPLWGKTPYADSKIKAEEFLQEWAAKNNVTLGIIRPSLIAGPNPPGNLGAMINGIKSGRYLSIAGSKARKSVLMVEDIARLVPLLAEKGGIYNVCDTRQITAREIIEHEREHQRIGAVIQKSMTGDAIKSIVPLGKGKAKCDYRYFDPATIFSNWNIDNTKAQRISTFRWTLKNTK